MSSKYRDEITDRTARTAAPVGDGAALKIGRLAETLTRYSHCNCYKTKLSKVSDSEDSEIFITAETTSTFTLYDVGFLEPFNSPLATGTYVYYVRINGFNVYVRHQCTV